MILDCGKPLSILYSDLREIDGVVCGQMVMQLPDDEGRLVNESAPLPPPAALNWRT